MGVYFEGFNEPGFQACFDANRLNSGISNDGSCTQSCVTPTPTPTPTMTPTPTATPCAPGCCMVELCYGQDECAQACTCREPANYYISILCSTDPCIMANALGIYLDDRCGTTAPAGYYSDGVDCYYWDGSSSLSNQGPC